MRPEPAEVRAGTGVWVRPTGSACRGDVSVAAALLTSGSAPCWSRHSLERGSWTPLPPEAQMPSMPPFSGRPLTACGVLQFAEGMSPGGALWVETAMDAGFPSTVSTYKGGPVSGETDSRTLDCFRVPGTRISNARARAHPVGYVLGAESRPLHLSWGPRGPERL